MEHGSTKMNIVYNNKTDLLYMRIDDSKHEITNRRVSEDVVLDIGEDGKIVGIEIMDASKNINLKNILPVSYSVSV
ncbi:MAG: hypothetical protein CVV44_11020 [Spirochaetae bacterium HGW-Spirochaetae-1]|nr:MAG: hypothetical protein CVV44_11020 [Spirochaetae bacterium HGW-Spirochaetae-1]